MHLYIFAYLHHVCCGYRVQRELEKVGIYELCHFMLHAPCCSMVWPTNTTKRIANDVVVSINRRLQVMTNMCCENKLLINCESAAYFLYEYEYTGKLCTVISNRILYEYLYFLQPFYRRIQYVSAPACRIFIRLCKLQLPLWSQ